MIERVKNLLTALSNVWQVFGFSINNILTPVLEMGSTFHQFIRNYAKWVKLWNICGGPQNRHNYLINKHDIESLLALKDPWKKVPKIAKPGFLHLCGVYWTVSICGFVFQWVLIKHEVLLPQVRCLFSPSSPHSPLGTAVIFRRNCLIWSQW